MFAFLIAAGAAVWGTFENIQSYVHKYAEPVRGAREYRFSLTWWTFDESGPSSGLPRAWFPPYGAIPAVAAGLLLVAAILAMTAFSNRRFGLVTGARVSAAVGAGVLAGAAAIRLLDALQTTHQVNAEQLQSGEGNEFQIGLGAYLPAGAAVLALIGLALTVNRGRAGRVEPDTPRMGFSMPYPPPQYVQQPEQPVPPAE